MDSVFLGPLISDEFPAPSWLVSDHPVSVRKASNKTRIAILSIILAISTSILGALWILRSGSDNGVIRKMAEESSAAFMQPAFGLHEREHLVTFADSSSYPLAVKIWTDHHYSKEFEEFQRRFEVVYPSIHEREKRYSIFKNNLHYIHSHNEKKHQRYHLAPNKFSDRTSTEFASFATGLRKSDGLLRSSILPSFPMVEKQVLPSFVDWRLKNCVTPVKDQSSCGSCWAFSTTGAIEGSLCAQTGKLVSLSEQQLVDCAGPEGNFGCNGGEMDLAYQYVIDAKGICTEAAYPYVGVQNDCSLNCSQIVHVTGFVDITRNSEKAMMAAVATYGPVAVALEADEKEVQFYHTGVFDAPCGLSLNHAVLLVGYGEDETTKAKYWTVKNSWGRSWGENGYIRLARKHHGKAGECGILLDGSVPLANTTVIGD